MGAADRRGRAARQVGVVFQDFALFPHLTVARNVAYGLHRIRDRAARQAEVSRALALVGESATLIWVQNRESVWGNWDRPIPTPVTGA